MPECSLLEPELSWDTQSTFGKWRLEDIVQGHSCVCGKFRANLLYRRPYVKKENILEEYCVVPHLSLLNHAINHQQHFFPSRILQFPEMFVEWCHLGHNSCCHYQPSHTPIRKQSRQPTYLKTCIEIVLGALILAILIGMVLSTFLVTVIWF